MLDDATMNLPATLPAIREIVKEYDEKRATISQAVSAFEKAVADAKAACAVGGRYCGDGFGRYGSGTLDARSMESALLKSAWRYVYEGLQIQSIAPASDRSKFETSLESPAPFTLDNIRETFKAYLTNPRSHILRGLAECFSQLDPAFKSHDRMKIGVKGLPKRIILSYVDDYGSSYGGARLKDTINALRVFNGLPHVEWAELSQILKEAKRDQAEFDGMTLRRFKNSNAHLIFSPDMLLSVNRALAEYYGDVLADCPEERPERAASTAVATDLQFYRTPDSVADTLVRALDPKAGALILEPSCGDGALLDALQRFARKERRDLRATGIEYDKDRAAVARAKGYAVQVANFLQVQPDPRFDYVLMNPPFFGKHYQKHVEHARKFLKPGGRLVAILPVTAVTDHGYIEADRWLRDRWSDLPVGSFSESGTNINTGIATFFAR